MDNGAHASFIDICMVELQVLRAGGYHDSSEFPIFFFLFLFGFIIWCQVFLFG